jgi:hypothetical protein
MTKFSKYLSNIINLVTVCDGVIKGKQYENTAFQNLGKAIKVKWPKNANRLN